MRTGDLTTAWRSNLPRTHFSSHNRSRIHSNPFASFKFPRTMPQQLFLSLPFPTNAPQSSFQSTQRSLTVYSPPVDEPVARFSDRAPCFASFLSSRSSPPIRPLVYTPRPAVPALSVYGSPIIRVHGGARDGSRLSVKEIISLTLSINSARARAARLCEFPQRVRPP